MTSSPPKADDVCAICEETRENHGDSIHEFSMDGVLTPKRPGPPPRNEPPRERGSQPSAAQVLGQDPVARLHLRMIERLVQKGVFDGEDLMYVFGQGDVSH